MVYQQSVFARCRRARCFAVLATQQCANACGTGKNRCWLIWFCLQCSQHENTEGLPRAAPSLDLCEPGQRGFVCAFIHYTHIMIEPRCIIQIIEVIQKVEGALLLAAPRNCRSSLLHQRRTCWTLDSPTRLVVKAPCYLKRPRWFWKKLFWQDLHKMVWPWEELLFKNMIWGCTGRLYG